jgi:hypothetical protein
MLKLARITAVLISLSSLSAFPIPKSAMAIVSGDVSVNGSLVKRSMPVFEGDRLRTGADSGVLLNLHGATVQLSANSDARYEGDRLALRSGSALVRGIEAVVSGPFTISAVGAAQFRIERSGVQTRLSILDGRVRVKRGKESLLLSGVGERQFSDEDRIGTMRRRPIIRDVAAGAAGAAMGTTATGWMKRGNNSPSISRKSPTEP